MLQPVKWAAAAVLALAVEVAAASAPGMPAALPLRRTLSGRPAAGASAARACPDLRILKPLRGGGGGDDAAVSAPVMVTFSVECHQTTVGESIGIVGSCAELGNWQDIAWVEVQMHELHSDIEFKYVRCAKMATLGSGSAGRTEIFRSRTPPQRTSSSTAANSVTSSRTTRSLSRSLPTLCRVAWRAFIPTPK